MPVDTPGGSYTKGYGSIGVPGYLIGTDTQTPATTSEPSYGTADGNGYVGVSQDYNSHANATDRPNSSSVKVSEDDDESEGVEATESSFARDAQDQDPYEVRVAEEGDKLEDVESEKPKLKAAAKNAGLVKDEDKDDKDEDDKKSEGHRPPAKKSAPVKSTTKPE